MSFLSRAAANLRRDNRTTYFHPAPVTRKQLYSKSRRANVWRRTTKLALEGGYCLDCFLPTRGRVLWPQHTTTSGIEIRLLYTSKLDLSKQFRSLVVKPTSHLSGKQPSIKQHPFSSASCGLCFNTKTTTFCNIRTHDNTRHNLWLSAPLNRWGGKRKVEEKQYEAKLLNNGKPSYTTVFSPFPTYDSADCDESDCNSGGGGDGYRRKVLTTNHSVVTAEANISPTHHPSPLHHPFTPLSSDPLQPLQGFFTSKPQRNKNNVCEDDTITVPVPSETVLYTF